MPSVTQACGDYSSWWRGGEFPALNRECLAYTSITDRCVTKELIHMCAVQLNHNIQIPYEPANSPKIPQFLHLSGSVMGMWHRTRPSKCRITLAVLRRPTCQKVEWYTPSPRPLITTKTNQPCGCAPVMTQELRQSQR